MKIKIKIELSAGIKLIFNGQEAELLYFVEALTL